MNYQIPFMENVLSDLDELRIEYTNEVTVIGNNKPDRIVYLTNRHIAKMSDLGKKYWVSNGRIYTVTENIEETVYDKSEILNDPFLNL